MRIFLRSRECEVHSLTSVIVFIGENLVGRNTRHKRDRNLRPRLRDPHEFVEGEPEQDRPRIDP